MTWPIHLHRIALSNPLAVHRFASALRLPDHPFDPDYVVHCLLAELFGRDAPKPFVRDPRRRGMAVLAYSHFAAEGLRIHAQTFAPPDAFRLVDWKRSASKPLPEQWPAGTPLGFRARVCPLVRGPSAHGKDKRIERRTQRPEVDAYLARVWREEESAPPRELVYREWLGRELTREGAARPGQLTLKSFRLARSLRRDDKRIAHGITRPDALFEGTLQVEDGSAFARLLARGLGRHRAFGFGMLLLRPAP